MEHNTKNRRRNYFIAKKFQTSFIIKFCILVVLGSIVSGVIIYTMSKSTVTTTFENSRLVIKSTADYILPAVLLSSAVVVVLTGLATIIVTLFTSHKIAGPLYRIQKDVEEVESGNLTKKFNIRRTDEIKALAETLNSMTQTLKADVDIIKQNINELDLAAETSNKTDNNFKEKIKNIKKVIDKFITN